MSIHEYQEKYKAEIGEMYAKEFNLYKTLKWRCQGSKGASLNSHIPMAWVSKCKSPEMEVFLPVMMKIKGASGAGMRRPEGITLELRSEK